MRHDLSGHGIELNLFPATFHQAVIGFSHPFREREL